jgi:hypothetical protein
MNQGTGTMHSQTPKSHLIEFTPTFGGSGCGFSITFEPFELTELFTAVRGGSGCGLIVTLDPGWAISPDFEFLPETIMIDLSFPVRAGPTAEACATTKPLETGRLIASSAGLACSARPSKVESMRRAPTRIPACIVKSFCI